MMFPVLSVNIGKPVPFEHTTPKVTGIFKNATSDSVDIGWLGLKGDAICDLAHHGGRDQAVYIYGQPDYDYWSERLGCSMRPGLFGENLTLANFESAKMNVGDRLISGELILEVTSPRIPCRTFAARMEDKHFVETFLKADRPGVYCRVLAPGQVQAGEAFQLQPFSGETYSIAEYNRTWKQKTYTQADIRRYLATPLHEKTRTELEGLLGGSQ